MPARGALTRDELFQVLRSVVDPEYIEPFLLRGYDSGLESLEMLCEVLARVSQSIDRSTQRLYIEPWSGQSDGPAVGAALARITLRLQRSARLNFPLTITAGEVIFEEIATEAGATGGVPVATGRRYTIEHDVTFLPGEPGPIDVPAIALRPGYTAGRVLPGTVTGILQPGAGLSNAGASVVQSPPASLLVLAPQPDVIAPQQVGQIVELVGGASAGQQRRVSAYERATLGAGGSVQLAPEVVVRAVATAPVGTFEPGETVRQVDTALPAPGVIASGVVLAATSPAAGPPWWLVVLQQTGAFQPTAGTVGPLTGVLSGATFALEDISQGPTLASEVRSAVWRVLTWGDDLGLTVTNVGEGLPGELATLDELGAERGVYRAPGETDESYRERVYHPADVVSPDALLRTANRILAPIGLQACLREVGQAKFRGLFADGDPLSTDRAVAFAYDMDGVRFTGPQVGFFIEGEVVTQQAGPGAPIARGRASVVPAGVLVGVSRVEGQFVPGFNAVGSVSGALVVVASAVGGPSPLDRWRVVLDYERFRAYFEIGVPRVQLGDFGVPFDQHPHNAFDAAPYLAGFDGFPVTGAVLMRSIWQAIDRARAGGVGFDLYVETTGCLG